MFWLQLINEAYLLCDKHLKINYLNRKAQEILDKSCASFPYLADRLLEMQEPKRSLRNVVMSLFSEDWFDATIAVKLGYHQNIPLAKERESPTEIKTFYKARVTKLSNELVLIVLRSCKTGKKETPADEFTNEEFSTLSHDFKTLLHGTIGNLELIREEIGLDARLYYQIALSSTKQLENKLNDLDDYLHFRSKTFKLHCSEFSISELIKDVVSVCEWPAKQKQINLESIKEGTFPDVLFGDRARIKQVLINLVSKAVDLTDYGTIIVCVYSKNESVGFRIKSMGPSMQLKLLMEKSLPSQLKRKSTYFDDHTQQINYWTRMHLEICELISKELMSNIRAKVLKKYSQLKFVIVKKTEPKHKDPMRKQSRRYTGDDKAKSGMVVKCINIYNVTTFPRKKGPHLQKKIQKLI